MSSRHQIRRVLALAYDAPWAITRGKLDAIIDLLDRRAGGHLADEEIEARLGEVQPRPRGDDEKPYRLTANGVAVISIYGVLMPRANLITRMSGGMSTQEIEAAVQRAVADEAVREIVLDVDSPGGIVLGCEECAAAIRAANATKPVTAVGTNQMTSAAYWLAASAGKVIASPSTQVGAIGVYSIHTDVSAADTTAGIRRTVTYAGVNKTRGNADESLNQEGRDSLRQENVDYYRAFAADVKRFRGLDPDQLGSALGERNTLKAPDALQAGLIDRVGTLSQVVDELDAALAAGPQTASYPEPTPISLVTGYRPLATDSQENAMDPRIMVALIKRGLISANDTKETAQAVLRTWYAVQGSGTVPESADQILADLLAADERPDAESQAADLASKQVVPSVHDPQGSSYDEARARLDERSRIISITERGSLLGVDASVVDDAISQGTSVEDFLLAVTDRKAQAERPLGRVESGPAQQDKFAEAAIESLASLYCPEIEGTPSAAARQMQHLSLTDLARESYRMAGMRLIGDKEDLARAALGDVETARNLGADAPVHGPGSFPNILSGLANKVLDATPPYQGTTFQNWAARRPSVPDFKPTTLLRYGEFGLMPEHVDGQDFEQSTISEEWGWIQVDSYGDEFALTPVMIANDDLGVFIEAIGDKRAAHDATLNRLCVNILTGNPTLTDGYALFDATNHLNYVASGSGAAPSETTLSAARVFFRKLTGPSAKRLLNLTPDYLLTPYTLETTVQKLLTATLQIYPTASSSAEIFKYTVSYDVEPTLDASSTTAWYLFARKARPIAYCYQRGYEQMRRRDYYNPKNNCRMFQFEGRFAAAVASYRGVFMNYGA